MAKRAQRQVRQVRRVVRPRNAPQPAMPAQMSGQQQRKQRQEYLASGGLLQGYAPETVLAVGRRAGAGSLACLAIGLAILLLLPYELPVRIAAAAVWLIPIALAATFIVPGYRLARRDRREEAMMVKGQLVGASPVSTSFGLGMLIIQARSGNEQYLVAADKLTKVPGNQVSIVLTVTPHLRHVRSLAVVGQRLAGRPEPPIPDVVKRLRLLPIVTPLALCLAAIIGADSVGLSPIPGVALHTTLAVVVAVALAGAAYGISFIFQRRMYAQVQSSLPGEV